MFDGIWLFWLWFGGFFAMQTSVTLTKTPAPWWNGLLWPVTLILGTIYFSRNPPLEKPPD